MEIWKDISQTNYQVSNEGRIRRVFRDTRTIAQKGQYRYLKLQRHKGKGTDYFSVTLGGKNGTRKLVHRLVATAFIPNPNDFPQVNHINGDGLDNRVENLEWVTNRENALHAKANGRTKPCFPGKKIMCVETGRIFNSSFEAADFVNASRYQDSHRIKSLAQNIRACAYGKRRTAYGYTWKQL